MQVGRWHSVDPKSEELIDVSPYIYALNNPIRLIDPDGEKAFDPNFLSNALNDAYTNSRAFFNTHGKACNYAVRLGYNYLTGRNDLNDIYAKDMYKHIVSSKKDWKKVTIYKELGFSGVQELANQGHLIVAYRNNHISIVRLGSLVNSGNLATFYNLAGFKIPLSLEANRTEDEQSMNYGFGSSSDVFDIEFYIYIGNDNVPEQKLEDGFKAPDISNYIIGFGDGFMPEYDMRRYKRDLESAILEWIRLVTEEQVNLAKGE